MLSRLAPSHIIAGCSCLLLLASCSSITTFGSSDGSGGEDESSSGLLSSASGQSAGGPTGTSGSSMMDASSSEGSGSTEEGTGSFIIDDPICAKDLPDGVLAHCTPVDCSVILQDCPEEGEACRPWANDGGSFWNSTRCVPVDSDPGQAGAVCTVQGSGTSGIDSCDIGLMCWDVDADTLDGTCIELCSGTHEEPTCPGADDVCQSYNDGVLPLCLQSCDPLRDDCDTQDICVPAPDESFACVANQYPECPSGTYSAPPDLIPGCIGDEPCCTPYCDTSGEATCERGLECVPYSEDPNPAYPSLGVCVGAA